MEFGWHPGKEIVAAEAEAGTAAAEALQEIASLKKELGATKRKLAELTEEFGNTCRENDALRQLDEGLFYPGMDYMSLPMPGYGDDITIGQHLSENKEVRINCKYLHVLLINLQFVCLCAGLFIITH
jgi:hypothetical protein